MKHRRLVAHDGCELRVTLEVLLCEGVLPWIDFPVFAKGKDVEKQGKLEGLSRYIYHYYVISYHYIIIIKLYHFIIINYYHILYIYIVIIISLFIIQMWRNSPSNGSSVQIRMHIREPAGVTLGSKPRGAQWDRCHKSVCRASPRGRKMRQTEDPII